MISRILDATVSLADRLEESAASRVIGAYGDLIIAGVSAKDVDPSTAADYALGCAGIAVSLTLRLAARRLGRPSFSPLMAWAQGLDDETLRTTQTHGDA